MKLTRNKLRQLINEALKPFFMGVEPSDLLDRLRQDPQIDSATKQLLNHPDPEMQRVGLEQVRFELGMTEKYPELDSDEFYLDTDFVDRSQPVYKKEFEKAQQSARDPLIRRQLASMSPEERFNLMKKIAKSIFTEVYVDDDPSLDYYPDMMVFRSIPPHKTRSRSTSFDPDEMQDFLDLLKRLGLEQNLYLVQPHQIILEFDLSLL